MIGKVLNINSYICVMEKWKNIKGYENYYQISNAGNIRSKDRIIINSKGRKSRYKSKERKPSFSEYRLIALSKNGIVSSAPIMIRK